MSILSKTFVGRIFPETDWRELDPGGYAEVYKQFGGAGQYSTATMEFLRKNRVKLGFHTQDNSGGGWTLLRNITLAPDAGLADFYTLSLIVHEVFHLQQPILTRLSVYGELLAWQYQRQAYREISGREMGDINAAYSGKRGFWDQLAKLSPDSRDDLAKAQQLMHQIAVGYRSDCLPLFPLLQEIGYYLRQGRIRDAFETAKNLITCR